MAKIPVYTIDNFDSNVANSELYVNTFKNHLKAHHFVERPHRHNFCLMVLFTHGHGIHEIDFDRYEIRKGSLFIIQPGQIHNWKLSEDCDGYIAFYSQGLYNTYFGNKQLEDFAFFHSVQAKPEIMLDKNDLSEMEMYFLKMLEESQGHRDRRVEKILNLLDTIHIDLSRKFSVESHHESHLYNHRMKEFSQLLSKNFIAQKSPSFYASALNISLKHLNRISKTILNKTVTEIITGRVLLEAKRLLANPNQSISQISDQLQLANPSYFTKLFKKHVGISPSEFRNRL